jgi:hypothetical protein
VQHASINRSAQLFHFHFDSDDTDQFGQIVIKTL